jgi:hypothetical protein
MRVGPVVSLLALLFAATTVSAAEPAIDGTMGGSTTKQFGARLFSIARTKYCPYINSGDNAKKAQILAQGCTQFASDEHAIYIDYVGKTGAPGCKVLIQLPAGVKCGDLK